MAPINNRSIRDWLKPVAKATSAEPSQSTSQSSSSSRTTPEVPTMRSLNIPKQTLSTKTDSTPSPKAPTASFEFKAPENKMPPTSSLSSPPSTDLSEPPFSQQKESLPPTTVSSSQSRSDRVIQNSSDEDSDSDSSLEDLSVLLAARSSQRARQDGQTPSTPAAPRRSVFDFHTSPMPVLTKYKFDMKSLVDHVQKEEATEASSKRVKAMIEARRKTDDNDIPMFHEDRPVRSNVDHGALLDTVVGNREDGNGDKVKRALKRTEATSTEEAWYFFDTGSNIPKSSQTAFPIASVSRDWKEELADPRMRQHTFLSGFAEDMVRYGKKLPDELFFWMLDEICYESSEPLRYSYMNVLKASPEQAKRLVDPKCIAHLFDNLGASPEATTVISKVNTVLKLTPPYPHRNWSNLMSVIKLLGRLAECMQLAAKTCSICMLLRMSMDKLVSENIDIFDKVQETITRLCFNITTEDQWTTSCTEIITILFNSVSDATLRLQTVSVLSSTHPRTHDLRRRLAMCFYFNSLIYASSPPTQLMFLEKFISRLHSPIFDTNPETDYRSLTSLILLLDIALDDGRSSSSNLKETQEDEDKFNTQVDALSRTIKDIFNGIGNPGAAFISRIEAKEVLELVSQRIMDTVRTKRPPKVMWFDDDKGKKVEDLVGEKKGMRDFMERMKGVGQRVK